MLKEFPTPLVHKIVFTLIIGIGCLIFGIAYFFISNDKIFLMLSGIICVVSITKALGYIKLAKNKQYEVVMGTCVYIAPMMLRKTMKVKMMDADGIETTLNLAKGNKLQIGEKYRLYFSSSSTQIVQSDFINTMLATDNFLGYEKLVDTDK